MGRKKTYRREDVLGKALDAFWQKGYHATSLADLVAATGLNKNTLYTAFGNKAALFEAALGRYTEGGVAHARQYLGRTPPGLENVRAYFRSMSYAPDCRGCLMTMTINEKKLLAPGHIDLVRHALARIEALLLHNLQAAYEAGHLRAAADPQRLATFFLFSIQGITTMGKYEGDPTKLEAVVNTLLSVLDQAGP